MTRVQSGGMSARRPRLSRTLGRVFRVFRVLAVAAGVGLLAGCALPAWLHNPPAFPANESAWEIPLFEPLTGMGPRVVATVAGHAPPGRAPPREEVVLYVDSGSSHSALLASTFQHLGVETTGSHFATIEDAAGVKRAWSGALIPEVRFGDRLALENVVASVQPRTAILGADVLAAHGWQIDLDRGTLLLGAVPWPAAPDVDVVPTHPYRAHALVDLQVGGTVVPVLLDTGAPFTVVDVSILRQLGLPEHAFAHPWPLGTGDRTARIDAWFEGEVTLGDLRLGVREVLGHPGVNIISARGMLGNDILFGYLFQVTAAGIRLKPRAPSLLDSVGARIARWRDLPSCAGAPGCVAADLVPRGDGTSRIHLRILAAPTRPFRYLFGCLDGEGRLRDVPFWIEIGLAHPGAGAEIDTDPEGPLPMRQMWAKGCARLGLLDANPIVAGGRPLSGAVEARFAGNTRRMKFR